MLLTTLHSIVIERPGRLKGMNQGDGGGGTSASIVLKLSGNVMVSSPLIVSFMLFSVLVALLSLS